MYIDVKQRTPEWFEARKGKVNASNAGAILGLNPYKTADDVMREMVRAYHGAESEFKGNPATEYGTFHEEGARRDYELETGNTVKECGIYIFAGWLAASPDGLIDDDGLIEIKCPYELRNGGDFKEITGYYHAQVQIQLLASHSEWCDFYQWAPHSTDCTRIYFNEKWIDANLPVLEDFYVRFCNERNDKKYLEPLRVDLTNNHAAVMLAQDIEAINDAIKRLEENKKEAIDKLVRIANNNNAIIGDKKLTFTQRQGAIAYAKAVKDLLPNADLEKYRGKASKYWSVK